MKVRCSTCERDEGWCVYCQRQFASPGRLHRHIHTQHPYTLRAVNCDRPGDHTGGPVGA